MGTTIVVVEDDPALRTLLCDILEDEGFRAIAVSWPDMLDHTLLASADLVITDLLFDYEPRGLEVLRTARNDHQPALPTLICSGAREQLEHHAAELAQLGAHLLLKPFGIDDLLGAVERALGLTPRPAWQVASVI